MARYGVSTAGLRHDSPVLTPGERRALSLSACGLLVPEVAEAMCTSPETVRARLASAIATLGARSKLEAVLIAARTGEIDLSP